MRRVLRWLYVAGLIAGLSGGVLFWLLVAHVWRFTGTQYILWLLVH